jgi:hypothetical protein
VCARLNDNGILTCLYFQGLEHEENEVTGEKWIKVHKNECYVLFSTLNIIRMFRPRIMRWLEHTRIARVGEGRGAYGVLMGNPEKKRPLVKPLHRGENNIKK